MRFNTYSLIERTKALYPGFRIVDKRKWWLTKLVAPIVAIFNPEFMGSYVTTIHDTMAYPYKLDVEINLQRFTCFCHERTHIGQWMRWRWIYDFLYLFPQSLAPLALFSLLAIWVSSWYLLWLTALLSLLPLPAPWRAWWEAQAVAVKIAVYKEAGFTYRKDVIAGIAKQMFASWSYYHMFPKVWAEWLLVSFVEGRFKNKYLIYALRDFRGCRVKEISS